MNFISFAFLLFIIILLILVFVIKSQQWKKVVLLIGSYFFYAYFDYRFLALLLFETLVCYFAGGIISNSQDNLVKRKVALGVSTSVLLLTLCVFKYFNFFVSSFCNAFNISEAGIVTLIVPIGISFYTFQAISYIVDVYKKETEHRSNFITVALCIGFFPQIVSGPIVRAVDFLPQLDSEIAVKKENIISGFWMFLSGVVKKAVIADRLAVCVNAVFSAPTEYSGISLLVAAVAYSIQLYCDFSGYSDMAIGIAKCFGFDLGKNFNLPYMSSNPTEFWKRWHISLSTWLMRYLYISLGGNRKGLIRTYLNLIIVMTLGGLWHGANWTFVLWGLINGIALVIHKVFLKIKKGKELQSKNLKTFVRVLCVLLNFIFATVCWIFFRADSISDAFVILYRIITFADGVNYIYIYALVYFVLVAFANIFAYIKNNGNAYYLTLDLTKFSSKVIFLVGIGLIVFFAYTGSSPFLYAQF